MTIAARLAALEHWRRTAGAWNVIADGGEDGATVYTVCGRWEGEESRRLTAEEYARFAAEHPIRLLRLYINDGGTL
jgi:hypothetical protein